MFFLCCTLLTSTYKLLFVYDMITFGLFIFVFLFSVLEEFLSPNEQCPVFSYAAITL